MSGKETLLPVEEEAPQPPRRLCSEIQLFDLCELERCRFKDDRFCTEPELLARFEAEAEPEDCPVWHFEKDADDEDINDQYPEECDEDDDDYSVNDDEDRLEQDDAW